MNNSRVPLCRGQIFIVQVDWINLPRRNYIEINTKIKMHEGNIMSESSSSLVGIIKYGA